MKYTFLTLAIATVLFTSCSTAYRAAQTPDDVYYSPAKEVKEYQTVATRDRYQENINSQDDRFLRMKVRDRDRWQAIDDYGYWYDSRYDFGMYNPSYFSYYNNGYYNNYFYNRYAMNNWYSGFGYHGIFSPGYYGYGGYYSPAYPVVYYKNPKVYTGATGKANLSTFMNTRYNNQNSYLKNSNESSFGNLVKKVFTPSNNNNSSNNSFDRPARTTNSSTAPSSNAGGRSGGYNSTGSSTGSSRPPR